MRVHIYKGLEGVMSVLLEPRPGKHKIPVLIQGVTRANVGEKVGPEIDKMRLSPAPK